MPTAAGTLNLKVQFQRRAGGVFSSLGEWQWGRMEFERPKSISVGGVTLEGRSGRLTVRSTDLAMMVTQGDRAVIEGHAFSIVMRKQLSRSTDDATFEVESALAPGLYAEMLTRDGATVEVVRALGKPEEKRATVKALVWGFAPDEIVTEVDQGKRHVLALASDFTAAGFPVPPKKNDRLFVRGSETVIQTVDADTHRVGTELNAYLMTVLGFQGM